jgi:hypothetical protein
MRGHRPARQMLPARCVHARMTATAARLFFELQHD